MGAKGSHLRVVGWTSGNAENGLVKASSELDLLAYMESLATTVTPTIVDTMPGTQSLY